MTLEEKIAHLQTTSMEQARSEGNAIIDSYKEALEKVLADHKEEAIRQSQTRIKAAKPGNGKITAGNKTTVRKSTVGIKR